MDERARLHMLGERLIEARMFLWLSKNIIPFFMGLILFSLLTSCTIWEPSLLHQIDRAERKWNSLGIKNYRIRVQAGGWWHLQNYRVVVQDGKVLRYSATCTPAPAESGPCKVFPFDPEEYTVPGLFAASRGGPEEFTTVTFHPDYGFPLTIRYDDPQLADEEQIWKLLEFSPENQ
jgi:hypothetical protein